MRKLSAFPSLDGLVDLACRDGVDVRPTLLRVITDLYVQKAAHTADEETQYVELTLGLIATADMATRAGVCATLRNYPAAPRPVLDALGLAAPAVAETQKAAAPAATPQTPAENELTELFLNSAPQERRLILANIDVGGLPDAPPAVSGDTLAALERAAMQRNTATFASLLASALRISPPLADRITRDASGEPLVVAARALGMQAAVLQRVLLFLDPAIGQSVTRVFDLAQLFDETAPEAARAMVSIWRGAPQTRSARPKHESVYYNDERRSARSAAGSTGSRAPRHSTAPRHRTRGNERA